MTTKQTTGKRVATPATTKKAPATVPVTTTASDAMISGAFGDWTPEEVAIIKATVAKNTTNQELAFYLRKCVGAGLDPFNGEIWCYKNGRGDLVIFAGRDGFKKKAEQNPQFVGCNSMEVRQNDHFVMDAANGTIEHTFGFGKGQEGRGEIVGAWALVTMANGFRNVEFVGMAEYNKGISAWKTNPSAMIRKVAETNAYKKVAGLAGVQSEYDFKIVDEVAIPVDQTKPLAIEELRRRVLVALDEYVGNDILDLRVLCAEKEKAGEFDEQFATNMLSQLQTPTTEQDGTGN